MHHILRFYTAHQELILRFYMFSARFTRLPLIGRPIKHLMSWYALNQHCALILSAEEARKIVEGATSVALGDCKCRKVFGNCDAPIRTDIVVGRGFDVTIDVRGDEYVEISREEALGIIEECSKMGLVQSLVRCRGDLYAICNCCQCCCVPWRLEKEYEVKNVWKRDKEAVGEIIEEIAL